VTIRFLEEAEAEFDAAVAYYNAQAAGVGTELAMEVQLGLSRIEKFPEAWQRLGRRVRRYRLNQFPYGIVYAALPSEIVVVAVMHLHRAPEYWRERLKRI
jgi:toxin ParE2